MQFHLGKIKGDKQEEDWVRIRKNFEIFLEESDYLETQL